MGRVLALDPGTVRIGVAVSDLNGILAEPRPPLDARAADLLDRVSGLVDELEVERIVVGLPVNLDGTEGASAAAAREFAEKVAASTGVETELVDERFTTVIAERALIETGTRREGRRQTRDGAAAAVLLQGYLERS